MALGSRRHIPLLVYITAPALARQLMDLGIAWRGARIGLLRHVLKPALAALVLAGAFWTHRMTALDYVPLGFGLNPLAQPEKALKFIEGSGLQPNLFNGYNWGGYVAWKLKEPWRPFMDGRVDVYGEERVEAYVKWINGLGQWPQAFAHYGIQTVLIDYKQASRPLGLGQQLWQSPQWALAYWDRVSLVFARRTDETAEAIAAHEYTRANPTLTLAELIRHNPPGPKRETLHAELERCLEAAPDAIPALAMKRDLLSLEGRYEEAIDLCERILELDGRNAQTHYRLGALFENTKDLDAAVEAYSKATRFDPHLTRAWTRLGIVCQRQGDVKKGLAFCQRALKEDSNDAEALFATGQALSELGRYSDSLEIWERYMREKPDQPGVLRGVAQLHENLGDRKKARRLLERALALDQEKGESHLAMASFLIRESRTADARKHFEAARAFMGPKAIELAKQDEDLRKLVDTVTVRSD